MYGCLSKWCCCGRVNPCQFINQSMIDTWMGRTMGIAFDNDTKIAVFLEEYYLPQSSESLQRNLWFRRHVNASDWIDKSWDAIWLVHFSRSFEEIIPITLFKANIFYLKFLKVLASKKQAKNYQAIGIKRCSVNIMISCNLIISCVTK